MPGIPETSPKGRRREQPPRLPLALDISGEATAPAPQAVDGDRCACCGLHTHRLWDGSRAGCETPHAVCTLCYLTGHLDSPTAGHGRLAWLPELSLISAIHLQRYALLAILAGTRTQRQDGKRLWRTLLLHSREVENAWGSARASEFAVALHRLRPDRRAALQQRLRHCALVVPADQFGDVSLLLPAHTTAAAVLRGLSYTRYQRSDLYAEPDPLD